MAEPLEINELSFADLCEDLAALRRDPDSDSYEGNLYVGQEQSSGQSWLSNESIIASIPDDKLRLYADRYSRLARLCQQELSLRGSGVRKVRARSQRLGDDNSASQFATGRRSRQRREVSVEKSLKVLGLDAEKLKLLLEALK